MEKFLRGILLLSFVLLIGFICHQPSLTLKKTSGTSKAIKAEDCYRQSFSVCVDVTMYYPVSSQCAGNPLITADGSKINPQAASEHKWIAASRDLLKRWGGKFDYGDTVLVLGIGKLSGFYEIHDTMNKRFRRKIDVLETTGTPLYKFVNAQLYLING